MMKRHTLLVLFLLTMAFPMAAHEHGAPGDASHKMSTNQLLPPWVHRVCKGENDTLRVPEEYGTVLYRFEWRHTSAISFLLGTDSIFVTGAINSDTIFLLSVFNKLTNDIVAQKYYSININPTYSQEVSVSACNRYSWPSRGESYTESTDTVFHGVTVDGCDSSITLHLTVNNSNKYVIYDTVCDYMDWHGQHCTVSGEYLFVSNGTKCNDSTVLHLTVNHSNAVDTIAVVCDSMNWRGTPMTLTGTATHTLTNANTAHCDSTVTLHLTVRNSSTYTDIHNVCDGLTWIDGNNYTASNNTAQFVTINSQGCDSTITLNLTVRNSSSGDTTAVACDSFIWWNTNYTNSTNEASHVFTNAVGCDSVVTLHLTVNRSNTGDTMAVVCDGMNWWGTPMTSTGTATHTLTNANAANCDSVVTLHLTVRSSSTYTDFHNVCDGLTWIDGNNYTASNNTAQYVLNNSQGCDSTVTLNLTVRNSSTSTDARDVCDSLTWIDGNNYTASNNTATYMVSNAAGCDSVINLNLTVRYSNTGDTMAVVCDGMNWWGTPMTSTGTATHTLTNANAANCDSVVTLHLTVRNSSAYTDTRNVCDSLKWIDGITYTSVPSVAPHFTTVNAQGCDSIITLNISIISSSHYYDNYQACNGFVWPRNNVFYSASNSSEWVRGGADANGCDSIFHLSLTVNNSVPSDTSATVCDSILWRGHIYYDNGDFIYTKPGTGVCTDTTTLHLTIHHATHNSFNAVACDSYLWNRSGQTYNSSGIKTYDYLSDNCPSVDTLHLTVNNSTSSTDIISACDSFRWIDGNTYTSSNNSAQFVVNNTVGCDSTITLNLTVHYSTHNSQTENVCDSFLWTVDGQTYVNTGNYTYSTVDSYGCDVVNTLDLTVRHGSYETIHEAVCESYEWVRGNIRQTFRESTVTKLEYFNEENCLSSDSLYLTVYGYPVPQVRHLVEKRHAGSANPWMLIYPRKENEEEYYYQWYRNDEPVNGANKQYFQLPTEQTGDTVVYSVWVASGNMSVCASFSNDTVLFSHNKALNIITFPNPAVDKFDVSVQSDDFMASRLDVYSESGQLMLSLPMQDNNVSVNRRLPSGVYILHVTSADGKSVNDKLMIK